MRSLNDTWKQSLNQVVSLDGSRPPCGQGIAKSIGGEKSRCIGLDSRNPISGSRQSARQCSKTYACMNDLPRFSIEMSRYIVEQHMVVVAQRTTALLNSGLLVGIKPRCLRAVRPQHAGHDSE